MSNSPSLRRALAKSHISVVSDLPTACTESSCRRSKRPLLGFDLETTGIDPHSDLPVSSALVQVVSGTVIDVRQTLINPRIEIPQEASSVHGITTAQAQNGIPLEQALSDLYETICQAGRVGAPIVGMNLRYDLTMLDSLVERYLGKTLSSEELCVLDVLVIDRHFEKYRKGSRKLADLAIQYGVELNNAHDALADTKAAIDVLHAQGLRYPLLETTCLHDLTLQQSQWHREWAEHYSEWRVSQGKPPLDDSEFAWPIAQRPKSPLNCLEHSIGDSTEVDGADEVCTGVMESVDYIDGKWARVTIRGD